MQLEGNDWKGMTVWYQIIMLIAIRLIGDASDDWSPCFLGIFCCLNEFPLMTLPRYRFKLWMTRLRLTSTPSIKPMYMSEWIHSLYLFRWFQVINRIAMRSPREIPASLWDLGFMPVVEMVLTYSNVFLWPICRFFKYSSTVAMTPLIPFLKERPRCSRACWIWSSTFDVTLLLYRPSKLSHEFTLWIWNLHNNFLSIVRHYCIFPS